MDLGLKGKRAIVCASTRGLGRGCATALAREGCDIVVNGRNAEDVARLADMLSRDFSVSAIGVAADVSTAEGREALLAACPEPDILVNNNGGPPRRDFSEMDEAKIIDGVTQNMVTPLMLIQAVADGMAARGFGRIVNVTSMSVYLPIEGLDLSSGARAGLTAFLAGVTPRYAGRGVTINNILPGKFDTDRLRSGFPTSAARSGRSVDEEAAAQAAVIPAARFGSAEEFGSIAAFLCSVHAGYITGQNILVDGGLHRRAF